MLSLSYYRQLFHQVIGTIRANKIRTALTCLGIIIGIASVISLWTLMTLTTESVMASMNEYGWNYTDITVQGNDTKPGFSQEDLDYFANINDNVAGVVGQCDLNTTTVFSSNQYREDVNVATFSPEYYDYALAHKILHGRNLTKQDNDNEAYVCIINNNLAGYLFQGDNPIGQSISVYGISFQIVGVFRNKEYDKYGGKKYFYVHIPFSIGSKISGILYPQTAYLFMADPVHGESACDEMLAYTESIFPAEKEFSYFDPVETVKNQQSQMTAQRNQQFMVAAISLLVGGIGIMNMMLVSVTERTKEIGLRKALGATPMLIQQQFLLEAIVLSLMGGLIGMICGAGISFVICTAMEHSFFIDGFSILISLGFSMIVGIVFGWVPARNASKLNPIDALRSE